MTQNPAVRQGHQDIGNYFRKIYRAAWILSSALVVSLLVYAAVVEVFRISYKGYLGLAYFESIRMIRVLFYMIGALEIIVIRIIRGLLLRKSQGEGAEARIRKLFRTSIISASLSEVPALLGLVLFFLTGQTRDFYILLAVSFFLLFMFFPRSPGWAEWAGIAYPRTR